VRILLTFLAVLVVVVLSAALIAPYWIDWNAYRSQLETTLGRALGANVRIVGGIQVRLLPTPFVRIEKLSVAGGAGSFDSEQTTVEVSAPSLVTGSLRITRAEFYRPLVRVSLPKSGETVRELARRLFASRSVTLDALEGHDLTVEVLDADGSKISEFTGLSVSASGNPSSGQLQIAVSWPRSPFGDSSADLTIAPFSGDVLPVKASIVLPGAKMRAAFDGSLDVSLSGRAGGAGPRIVGGLELLGLAPLANETAVPWRLAGPLTLESGLAALEPASLQVGIDQRSLRLSGSARLVVTEPATLSLRLDADQLDFDSFFRTEQKSTASVEDLLSAANSLRRHLSSADQTNFRWRLAAKSNSLIVGSQSISAFDLSAESLPDGETKISVRADVPGDGQFDADGIASIANDPQFNGKVGLKIGDITPWRIWLTSDAPNAEDWVAELLSALTNRGLELNGEIAASPTGVSLGNLRVAIGRSLLNGAFRWTRPRGDSPAHVAADFDSDELDLDAVPDVEASSRMFGGADFSLAVKSKAFKIARVGESELTGGSLIARIARTGDRLSVDRLSIDGLGGVALEFHGSKDRDAFQFDGSIDSGTSREVLSLVERAAPGFWTHLIAGRAARLFPLSLDFEGRGVWSAETERPRSLTTVIKGRVADASLDASVASSEQGSLEVEARADSQNSGELLGQLLPVSLPKGGGPAQVNIVARGSTTDGLEASATAKFMTADFAWRGRVDLQRVASGVVALEGSATLSAPNAESFLTAVALAPSQATPIASAIAASALVKLDDGEIALSDLTGTIGGSKFSGSLRYSGPPSGVLAGSGSEDIRAAEDATSAIRAEAQPQITGSLKFDVGSLADVLALKTGPLRLASAGSVWSSAGFAPPTLSPPSADIQISFDKFEIGEQIEGRLASARLRANASMLAIENGEVTLPGGNLAGRLTASRSGDTISLTGSISTESFALSLPTLVGSIAGKLDFASSGSSPSEVIANLSGAGAATLSGSTIPKLDIGALQRLVERVQERELKTDQDSLEKLFSEELDKGKLTIPNASAPISMTIGQLSLANVPLSDEKIGGALSEAYDVRSKLAKARVVLAYSPPLPFWSGAPPSAVVTLTGTTGALQRDVDVGALAAGLTAQAIARESDRIANFEADVRERAYFNRRFKAELFMLRREAELAAFAQQQALQRTDADRSGPGPQNATPADSASDASGRASNPGAIPPTPGIVPSSSDSSAKSGATLPPSPAPSRISKGLPDSTGGGLY